MITKFKLFLLVLCFQIGYSQEDNDGIIDNINEIEEAPIFPGCEKKKGTKIINCFQEKIQEHIQSNLKFPKEAVEKKQGGRVYAVFIIEKDGSVTIENIRAPYKLLKEETIRIISLLPKMTPGRNKNENVRVRFSIPITFDYWTKKNPLD